MKGMRQVQVVQRKGGRVTTRTVTQTGANPPPELRAESAYPAKAEPTGDRSAMWAAAEAALFGHMKTT